MIAALTDLIKQDQYAIHFRKEMGCCTDAEHKDYYFITNNGIKYIDQLCELI
jgi:hypothetical protein